MYLFPIPVWSRSGIVGMFRYYNEYFVLYPVCLPAIATLAGLVATGICGIMLFQFAVTVQ